MSSCDYCLYDDPIDGFHHIPDPEGIEGTAKILCSNAAVWEKLEATPGFNEAMESGVAQIAEGKSHPLHSSKERPMDDETKTTTETTTPAPEPQPTVTTTTTEPAEPDDDDEDDEDE